MSQVTLANTLMRSMLYIGATALLVASMTFNVNAAIQNAAGLNPSLLYAGIAMAVAIDLLKASLPHVAFTRGAGMFRRIVAMVGLVLTLAMATTNAFRYQHSAHANAQVSQVNEITAQSDYERRRTELQARESRAATKSERLAASKELAGLQRPQRYEAISPEVQLIEHFTKLPTASIALYVSMLGVLFLEIGSTFGFYVAGRPAGRKAPASVSVPVSLPNADVQPKVLTAEVAVTPEPEPETSVPAQPTRTMSTLERYLTDKGYRPTQREIAADTGLSLGVVNAQMQQLRRQGFPLAQ